MKNYRSLLLLLSLATLPIFAVVFWRTLDTESTLPTLTEKADKAGVAMLEDLRSIPVKEIREEEESYIIEEDGKDGIDISFASSAVIASESSSAAIQGPEEKPKTTLSLPKDYGKPIEVRLDEQRIVLITDLNGNKDYEAGILADQSTNDRQQGVIPSDSSVIPAQAGIQGWARNLLDTLDPRVKPEDDKASTSKYLSYTSPDERKTHLYAYQKDQASGEKKLKSWTLYSYGLGKETESYKIENAKVKIDDDGNADVFFFGQSDIQSEQAKADVDPNLMDRAQKFLEQETGNDIMNDTNRTPDFTIPRPTYFTKDGQEKESDWTWDDTTKTLSVALTENPDAYPIALDPTLAFTAPGSTSGGDAIVGEAIGNYFGYALTSGDFSADGRTDLVVGAYNYSNTYGRAYIFYNDSGISAGAVNADVIIEGVDLNAYFGASLASGDFNADGKIDLVVSAYRYSANSGRAYIFYQDGSYPATIAGADVVVTGEASGHYFGVPLATGDFNADGKTDLVVVAKSYSSSTGRTYVFYGGSIVTENASGADIIITGETTGNVFGSSVAAGDFNDDGTTDLAVGASDYSTNVGRVYVFYGGSMVSELASGADVFITGAATNSFGKSIAAADLNADGKDDLAVGGTGGSWTTGNAHIFYGGSIVTETASGADVSYGGEGANNYFGNSLATGDFNADGRVDFVVSAYGYSSNTGRTYIFYNDGSYPSITAKADVIITGEGANNYFGDILSAGDFNTDGKIDLAASACFYASNTGKVYLFYSQNGQVNTNKSIAGESVSDFSYALAAGDFNADGATDLIAGAPNYSTNTGRAYVFYQDGSYPTVAASADAVITGETTSEYFGYSFAAGDFNADGETDIAIGAYRATASVGRAYIFYNGSIVTETASGADIIITGEASSRIGISLAAGDFNADGKTDLAAGAYNYSAAAGRTYIFYNGSIITENASGADIIISGEGGSSFGMALTTGDFNADGKTDLAVGASAYSTSTGRAYIFYNGSIVTEAATGADAIIQGEATTNYFGRALSSGDLNADGKTDLVVGAYGYSASTGRAYIFYNGSIVTENASGADVIIQGEASGAFGWAFATGDFNADGKIDLAAGGYISGRAYIFHNDGSIPTTAAMADVNVVDTVTDIGTAFVAGDFNQDGRTDLVMGDPSGSGNIYFYETRENFAWQVQPVSGLRTSMSFAGQEMKITGESGATGQFGGSFAMGDFNADGKTDLAVGAPVYASNTGRVYLFYSDGSLASGAPSADVVIQGEAMSSSFGSLAAGDFNADGKTDLAVGAIGYSTSTGRVYIFYQDGSYPAGAGSADIFITGEGNEFGTASVAGDFNADGKTDLAVSAYSYSAGAGRAYVFYADGTNDFGTAACSGVPSACLASNADVKISGESASSFGISLEAGDFNADGKTDLVAGAYAYATFGFTGRVYIFYNGSIITEAATGADIIITGEAALSLFGYSLVSGDWNVDGKTDLAVGAIGHSSSAGRAYIFYNGSIITENASGADVIIQGESSSNSFGSKLISGDFNGDGRIDLAIGANQCSSYQGRAYIFYNDGSIPTTAATADLMLQGEATNNYYGGALAAGDFNGDGKTDLIVGAYGYGSNKGRVYLYTFNDGVITGEANSYFGQSLASGDFNADGRTDLVVGAYGYSSSTGRVYLFYNDGLNYPTTGAYADVIITGEATNNYFGKAMIAGDFNTDGKIDLSAGAFGYSSNAGRAYIFYNGAIITENASGADFIIEGESWFGQKMSVADLNADGRTDLIAAATTHSGSTGRVYVFYNDGSIPTTAATADVIISGQAGSNWFGGNLSSGDFNADGKIDLAVGAYGYSTNIGRAYIFYNGSIITENASGADIIIQGEATNNSFGSTLTSGDFNTDGRIDMAVAASAYDTGSSDVGRVYLFYNDGSIPTVAATADVIITGEDGYFGGSLAAGDFNADGKIDLAVGAYGYATNTGRAYVFYNDGSIPTTAVSADLILTGGATINTFGGALTSGDFNADGKIDLATGADSYSSSTGRLYIFITEVEAVTTQGGAKLRGNTKFRGNVKVR